MLTHSSILPTRQSRIVFSTQFEIKAFKDLNKIDRNLLVIFIQFGYIKGVPKNVYTNS